MITTPFRQNSYAVVAAHEAAPRQPDREPSLRLIAEFDDDAGGACALADTVRMAARQWGVQWACDSLRHLAYVQAIWLLANEHPDETRLYLHAEYFSSQRKIIMLVGDPGALLPSLAVEKEWQRSLAGAMTADAFYLGSGDRRLLCAFRVRAPWRMRKAWDTDLLDGTHPEHTFEDCESRNDLRRTLSQAHGQKAVRAAVWQGPDDLDDTWHESGEMPVDFGRGAT